MRIYFAHPISDYGTRLQDAAIKALASNWQVVENPDAPHHQEEYQKQGMVYFERIAAGCDALAYLRFRDGAIGAGVAREIAAAREAGRPIFEVRVHNGSVHVCSSASKPGPVLTVEQTRHRITDLGRSTLKQEDAT